MKRPYQITGAVFIVFSAFILRESLELEFYTSIGPGALNVVTAAGVAMANRLPLLIISGDTFVSRVPDPVLQQIEQFSAPSVTANDAFRPVVRYWDRITSPEQLLQSLPQAVGVLLDPAECGPVFLGLPQDVHAARFLADFIAREDSYRSASRRLLGNFHRLAGLLSR